MLPRWARRTPRSPERAGGTVAAVRRLPPELEAKRPEIDPGAFPVRPLRGRPRVLAIGIALVDRLNTAADVVARLAECRSAEVDQRWIAIGGEPADDALRAVTVRVERGLRPKYELLNELLAGADAKRADFLVLVDDDILLPIGFFDEFLAMQRTLGFAIAQPARTAGSWIDLPIVERHPGLAARRTLFVEQGPVISFARPALDFVLPFDLTSPMGWGFENLWSLEVERRGLAMGILDRLPVDHSLRKPVANYSWHEADAGRSRLFASRAHRPTVDCFRVLEPIPFASPR